MLACKCDRCKNYFETGDNGRIFKVTTANILLYGNGDPRGKKYYDLCPSCFESFGVWLWEGENEKDITIPEFVNSRNELIKTELEDKK